LERSFPGESLVGPITESTRASWIPTGSVAPSESAGRLASEQARQTSARDALRRVRWLTLKQFLNDRFAESRFRTLTVACCAAVFWGILFFLFLEGFAFLTRFGLVAGSVIEMLFGIYFSSLMVMLTFSTGILIYAGLFASREAVWLLTRPIDPDRVFAFKFQEALFFSSVGFVLLSSPILTAYGLSSEAGPFFYLISAAFTLMFPIVPGCLGAILCLLVTNLFPRRRFEVLVCLGVIALSAAAWFGWQMLAGGEAGVFSGAWLNGLLRQSSWTRAAWLPSRWMTRGLLMAVRPGGVSDSLLRLALLTVNGLALYVLTAWLHRLFLRRGYDRSASAGSAERSSTSMAWLDRLDRLLPMLHPTTRTLIRKDIRMFLRDPLQWLQTVIFAGLLVVYFISLRRMTWYTTNPYWQNLIGFFNLAVTGLLLATFTSRFVFPLLSLEGRRFWILGLSPVSRKGVVQAKFAFSAGGALLVTGTLTLIGSLMLRIPPGMMAVHLFTITALCLGVSGISVGLGARFPDMKQTDPSKIASGFGGTLNLVASLAYIGLVVAVMAVPCHLHALRLALADTATADTLPVMALATTFTLSDAGFAIAMTISVLTTAGLTALAVLLPMRTGIAAFRRMEF
jgi:ABC-2 type transport system permease protein